MSLSFRKLIAKCSIVFALLTLATTAQATLIKTLEFSATLDRATRDFRIGGVQSVNPASVFADLGFSEVSTVTGTITYDTMAAPLLGPTTLFPGQSLEQTFARLPYDSFETSFGTLTLGGIADGTRSDTIQVSDGTGSGVQHQVIAGHGLSVQIGSPSSIGPLTSFSLVLRSEFFDNPFDGATPVPDLLALNALQRSRELSFTFEGLAPTGESKLFYTVGDLSEVVADNEQLAGVPEPATIALFGIGVAGLGFLRRRKRVTP